MIVDRQGSDADVGRCGVADSPVQMGSESEYLQRRTVSGAPRDIRRYDRLPSLSPSLPEAYRKIILSRWYP